MSNTYSNRIIASGSERLLRGVDRYLQGTTDRTFRELQRPDSRSEKIGERIWTKCRSVKEGGDMRDTARDLSAIFTSLTVTIEFQDPLAGVTGRCRYKDDKEEDIDILYTDCDVT